MRVLLQQVAWEYVNPAVLRARRKRTYAWNSNWAGLNLACGLNLLPNWAGIDGGVYVLLQPLPSAVLRRIYPMLTSGASKNVSDYIARLKAAQLIHHDLTTGIPVKAGVVPNIYSSHFFEHITRPQAEVLLHECRRVLRDGGRLRIVVPSLDLEVTKIRQAIDRHERGDSQPVMRYLRHRVGYFGPFSSHQHVYDFEDMQSLLASAGFGQITECGFQTGQMQDVAKLDNRPESLFVEAIK